YHSSVSQTVCLFVIDTVHASIYTLSLHDALPISGFVIRRIAGIGFLQVLLRDGPRSPARNAKLDVEIVFGVADVVVQVLLAHLEDRKSTRLNSSHVKISYAVFCLKKKKTNSQMNT